MHANMSERKVNRMIGKRQLIAFVMLVALTVFGVLNLDTVRLSAYESPAVYISPAYVSTGDPWSAAGTNYTFSVLTDYDGNDVWGYEFKLTYNPNVLEGIEVVNGDLITGGVTMWSPGDFNNTTGELGLTGNGFYYQDPPPPMTSGPGILANVTFTVVGYGISNITFVESKTRLIGYDPEHPRARPEGDYDIINEDWPLQGHIEGSVFYNTLGPWDVDINGIINILDILQIAVAFGTSPGDPKWNPQADVDPNGIINILDVLQVAVHFGESYP